MGELKKWREQKWVRITSERLAMVEGWLKGEVETYDQYLTGQVYGFTISEEEGDEDELDSCWGFYGLEHTTSEMESSMGWNIFAREAKRQSTVKTLIKNKVPLSHREERLC